jgi:hypothetical protein
MSELQCTDSFNLEVLPELWQEHLCNANATKPGAVAEVREVWRDTANWRKVLPQLWNQGLIRGYQQLNTSALFS